MFSESYGMRKDVKKVLLMITDGGEVMGKFQTDIAMKTIKDLGNTNYNR